MGKRRYCTNFVIALCVYVCPLKFKFPSAGPIGIRFRFQRHHAEKIRSVRLTVVSTDQFLFIYLFTNFILFFTYEHVGHLDMTI